MMPEAPRFPQDSGTVRAAAAGPEPVFGYPEADQPGAAQTRDNGKEWLEHPAELASVPPTGQSVEAVEAQPPAVPPPSLESGPGPADPRFESAQPQSEHDPAVTLTGPRVRMGAGLNYGTMIGQLIQETFRIHRGLPLPPDWVNQQLTGYVQPQNEPTLADKLYKTNVLVLTAAAAGSGRWTTALKLLKHAPDGPLTIRRVRREAGDEFQMSGLRSRERTGWILDLRAPGENVPPGTMLGIELAQAQILKDAHSYLVVLLSPGLWEQIGAGASNLADELDPPDAADVLVSHLNKGEICPDPGEWARDHRIQLHLKGLNPGQARSWVQTIEQVELDYGARAAAGAVPADAFAEKVDAAIKSHSGWFDEIANWHSDPARTSFERNYLLTMAVYDSVFEDRQVDDVHEKVTSLAGALGEIVTPPRGHEGPGLVELTRKAGAKLQPSGIVVFPGPGYAEAVTDYFWLDRPHLLDGFTRWTVKQCLGQEQPYQSRLADKVIPWVLRHTQSTRSTPFLRSVAERWSEEPRLANHAADLLTAACLDQLIGKLTRDALGDWVGQARTTAALKRTLTQVFQAIAPVYPKATLRRLATLAESAEPAVGDAVGAAIRALWEDKELRPRLLEVVTAWPESPKREVQQAAVNAFLHVARTANRTGIPVLIADDTATSAWVTNSWRRVLEEADLSDLALEAARAWLDAAATSPSEYDRVMNVFVSAVHGTRGDDQRGTRSYNLMRIAEDWRILGQVLDEADRNRIRADLVDRMRESDPQTVTRESTGGA
jgi:hypothetical protein